MSWFLFLGYGKVLLLCDGIIFVYYQYVMKDDPQKRKPNINKAKEILNWEPKIDFNVGLEKTIKYFAGRK